uniref:Uncharacterized protein n=1 Tax=Arundo donax TaxID=35708 RepID=A0A0A9CN04_ARUDO
MRLFMCARASSCKFCTGTSHLDWTVALDCVVSQMTRSSLASFEEKKV